MKPGRKRIFTDQELETALQANGGDLVFTAHALGCAAQTARSRTGTAGLTHLVVPRRLRPFGTSPQVVSSNAIVEALDRRGSLLGASEELGIRRNAITARAFADPAIAAAIQRAKGALGDKSTERIERRRSELAEKISVAEERRRTYHELRERWSLLRTSWLVEARERGLTMLDAGTVLGITRERVRQLEEEAGLTPRSLTGYPRAKAAE